MKELLLSTAVAVMASGCAYADIRSVIDTTYSSSDYAASRSYAISEIRGEMKPKLKFSACGLVVMDGAVYTPAAMDLPTESLFPISDLAGR